MASLKALKIRSTGFTSSFRYPRIQAGTLKTFEMPPPATIYGHLASLVGEWFDPEGLQFAYFFEHQGRGVDLESRQPIKMGSGRNTHAKHGWNYPINVECEPNPQPREFLFRPRLTLYLIGSDAQLDHFAAACSSPFFSYVLGRSQDLATCHFAQVIELHRSANAFFSHTLLPYEWRPWVLPGTSVMMPEVIDYRRNRAARHTRYLQITRQSLAVHDGTADVISRDRLPALFAVDTEEVQNVAGISLPRGLHFLPVLNSLE